MSTQNFIASHCSALLKKTHHFSSYDDPALMDLNTDISNSNRSNFADVMLKLLLTI
jgi:hypothetical protein